MLTLIHKPMTRSGSIVWLLEEIGTPYETKIVSTRAADGSGSADPANPHPHAKVPALVHDGCVVFESSAITLYLTDLFPDAKLGPRIGDAKRGEYLSWLAYRSGVMEPAFIMVGGGINFMLMFKMMSETPALRDYCERLVSRPAYLKMMQLEAAR